VSDGASHREAPDDGILEVESDIGEIRAPMRLHAHVLARLQPVHELKGQIALQHVELPPNQLQHPHGRARHAHELDPLAVALPAKAKPSVVGPCDESKRPASDGLATKGMLRGDALAGKDADHQPPGKQRVGAFQMEVHRARIERLDAADHAEPAAMRRARRRIEHRVVGRLHVPGGERLAVVKAMVPAA